MAKRVGTLFDTIPRRTARALQRLMIQVAQRIVRDPVGTLNRLFVECVEIDRWPCQTGGCSLIL